MGIEIRDLSKSFNGKEVLKGLNLDIHDGEVLTVIGGSGQGKSVLFKHVLGIFKPDGGSIIIDGVDISKLNDAELLKIQSKFGMLFQSAALFDSLNVYENVAFGLRHLTSMNEIAIKRRVTEVLAMVSMQGNELLSVSSLSGGMKKRVALARALATSPKYLLYDEPTTGLDPLLAESINDLILDLNKQTKISSVVVTHDMHSAFKVSHRIAFLHDGLIQEIGTVGEIKNTKLESLRNFINAGNIE
ncbi:MAG: ATP-binding cassette domain-containing protein [Candidatus Omnitrophota bacterium]|nr:ATP-binding cassette domain-containing protein [Elusimicrobiota bacterium]